MSARAVELDKFLAQTCGWVAESVIVQDFLRVPEQREWCRTHSALQDSHSNEVQRLETELRQARTSLDYAHCKVTAMRQETTNLKSAVRDHMSHRGMGGVIRSVSSALAIPVRSPLKTPPTRPLRAAWALVIGIAATYAYVAFVPMPVQPEESAEAAAAPWLLTVAMRAVLLCGAGLLYYLRSVSSPTWRIRNDQWHRRHLGSSRTTLPAVGLARLS